MNKMSIESANPFMDVEHITNNISDIVELRTKVVFKTDNGLIVSLQMMTQVFYKEHHLMKL